MEGVNQVKLQDIDQVNPHLLASLDLDGVILIMEGNSVDGVKIIGVVKVYIKAIHHHHQLMVNLRPAFFGVNNKGPVQALGNMPGQGKGMAMVEMQAKRLGVKLIGKALAWLDQARPGSWHP